MTDIIKYYPLPPSIQSGSVVLRSRTIIWHENQDLVVTDASGTRTIATGWNIYSHELTPDGEFVLALGDNARHCAIWETRTGRQLFISRGDEDQPQSLRAGMAYIEGNLVVLIATRNKDVSIRRLRDGADLGWILTTGGIWFHVLRVFQIDERWFAIHGHEDGEARDTVMAIPAIESQRDPMVIYSALRESPKLSELGYRAAIGPAGSGRAVMFRDPEWDDDEPPDDPDESFLGLIVWDLENKKVVHRIEYDSEIKSEAIIGADAERAAIAIDGSVDIVSFVTGAVHRVEAVALDPYRLEIARIKNNMIEIARI